MSTDWQIRCFAALLCLLLDGNAVANEAEEPPLMVEVHIGDAKTLMPLGGVSQIELANKPLEVRLEPQKYRSLRVNGATFNYPSHFAFEHDSESPPLEIWSLDGNNCVIMLHRFPPVLGDLVATTTASLVEQYGQEHCEVSDVSIKLNGKKRTGKRVAANVVGEAIAQELYGWEGKRHRFMLMLQDSPSRHGKATKEFTDMVAMLKKSFKE